MGRQALAPKVSCSAPERIKTIMYRYQYLRQLDRVGYMVNPPEFGHPGNGLLNKNRLWHFRYCSTVLWKLLKLLIYKELIRISEAP